MKEKPLCGYCYNECTDDCCDKRRIDVLERQLEEAREENKKLKSEVFVIMRSGAHSDFPVSFKHTKEEADSEALKLDKQEKFFPHYVEQLKKEGENE
jgi:hypothetical protein